MHNHSVVTLMKNVLNNSGSFTLKIEEKPSSLCLPGVGSGPELQSLGCLCTPMLAPSPPVLQPVLGC